MFAPSSFQAPDLTLLTEAIPAMTLDSWSLEQALNIEVSVSTLKRAFPLRR